VHTHEQPGTIKTTIGISGLVNDQLGIQDLYNLCAEVFLWVEETGTFPSISMVTPPPPSE
jgi:hypothetical protein